MFPAQQHASEPSHKVTLMQSQETKIKSPEPWSCALTAKVLLSSWRDCGSLQIITLRKQ